MKPEFVPRDAVVVEEGAGRGKHTVELSKQYDKGHIHAFETNPEHAESLDAVTLNLHNVSVYPYGLSNRLYPDPAVSVGTPASILVPLDSVARQWDRLDLIIIRSQYKQATILDGAKETIARFHPVILLQ